jgi:hypothetical protein
MQAIAIIPRANVAPFVTGTLGLSRHWPPNVGWLPHLDDEQFVLFAPHILYNLDTNPTMCLDALLLERIFTRAARLEVRHAPPLPLSVVFWALGFAFWTGSDGLAASILQFVRAHDLAAFNDMTAFFDTLVTMAI